MDCVTVSTDVLYKQKEYYIKLNSDYNLDMWQEVKKRWLIFGVLLSIMMAVLAPRVGAPGGPLHTEYVKYIPLVYIYYFAGCRANITRAAVKEHARLSLLCAFHAHVVSVALSVATAAVAEGVVDHRIVKGALLSSVGGPCAWLSLSISQSSAAALAIAVNYALSLLAAPLTMLVLCGRATIPPLGGVLSTLIISLTPFTLGVLRPRPLQQTSSKIAALLLLYADCCTRLTEAEGSLYVGDVLITLILDVCSVGAQCAACWVSARAAWGAGGAGGAPRPRRALTMALCAVPKALDHGWESSTSCSVSGLSRLPGVLLAPAQALLLAALGAGDGDDDDEHDREY